MAASSAAEVQERFERIIQGIASPLQEGGAQPSNLPPGTPLQQRPSGDSLSSELGGAPPGQQFAPPPARLGSGVGSGVGASGFQTPPPAAGPPGQGAPLMGPPPLSAFDFSFSNTQDRPGLPPQQPQRPPSYVMPPAERPGYEAPPFAPPPSALAGPPVEDPFLLPTPQQQAYFDGRPGPGPPPDSRAGPGFYTPSGRMPDDNTPLMGNDVPFGGDPGMPQDDPEKTTRRKRAQILDYAWVESTMRVFPSMFSFFCLATFSMPIWITYHIGNDENVRQWISTKIWLVLFLFVPYGVAHVIHQVKGHPVRVVLVICLVGSSFVLLLIGDYVLLKAYNKSNEFYSQDCETFPGKRELEKEWQDARVFYANCLATKAFDNNITFQRAVLQYRIQSCPGYYDKMAGSHPDWHYLGFLEETYRCSGWCQEGNAMWTFASTSDACSSAVADVMYNKIQWSQMQVVLYTIVVLGFVSTTLITVGPILVRLGFEW